MLIDHGVAIRGIHEELTLLRELLTGRLPPPRASLLASSAIALPTSSTGPFAVETAEKMLTRQVSVAVRLQAAARGLLARRRVGRLLDLQLIQPRTPSQFLEAVRRHTKAATTTTQLQAALRVQAAARGFLARRQLQTAHKHMRDREAALAAVASRSMATNSCVDPLLCPRVHMVFIPQTAYSNSAGTVVGEVCSSLSLAGTHFLAPQLSVSDHHEYVSVGICHDCF
jgi:hypothetical protein